jgi:hypothetical protein
MFSEQKNNYCTVPCEFISRKRSFSLNFVKKVTIFLLFIMNKNPHSFCDI